MDPDVLSVGAILAGIFAATIIFIWQINSQSSRLETKIDELKEEIEAQGRRVSESELEQARLDGVNSVLLNQTHTHESIAD